MPSKGKSPRAKQRPFSSVQLNANFLAEQSQPHLQELVNLIGALINAAERLTDTTKDFPYPFEAVQQSNCPAEAARSHLKRLHEAGLVTMSYWYHNIKALPKDASLASEKRYITDPYLHKEDNPNIAIKYQELKKLHGKLLEKVSSLPDPELSRSTIEQPSEEVRWDETSQVCTVQLPDCQPITFSEFMAKLVYFFYTNRDEPEMTYTTPLLASFMAAHSKKPPNIRESITRANKRTYGESNKLYRQLINVIENPSPKKMPHSYNWQPQRADEG